MKSCFILLMSIMRRLQVLTTKNYLSLNKSKQGKPKRMQEIFLREDIHQLSNSLQASKFNQKNIQTYKKRMLTKNTIKIKSIHTKKQQSFDGEDQKTATNYRKNNPSQINHCNSSFSNKNFDKIMTMKSFHNKSLNKRSKTNPIQNYEYEGYGNSQSKKIAHMHTASTAFSHKKTSFGRTYQTNMSKDLQVKHESNSQNSMENYFMKTMYKKILLKKQNIIEQGQSQVQQTILTNKFDNLEKKFNKGPIKQKHLERWLDSLLIECSIHQNFSNQAGVQNEGLKKYLIDPVSLSSQGITKKDIERIYKGLFVYSIGFNNLLKEVTCATIKKSSNNVSFSAIHPKKEVQKTIWKVYSMLIQYCAKGNFECIVSQIERDKVLKLQEYKQELERKQNLLQKNEVINQQNNINIIRQNKRLYQANYNLENERQTLLQDFQATQQAFNEQVLIRIKYENRINQVYGIHRELGNKHMILYEDLKKKKEELSNVEYLYMNLLQQYSSMKFKLSQKQLNLKNLQIQTHYQKNLIASLDEEKTKIKAIKDDSLKQYQQCKAKLQYQEKKDAITKSQLQNLSQLVDFRTKSAFETNRQYQIALQENRRLYLIISSQRQQLESLLKEKKAFNHRTLAIITESSINQKKYLRKNQQCERLYKKVDHLQQKRIALQLQLDIQKKNNGAFKDDLSQNYQNIRKMHQSNYLLQEELETLRKKSESIDVLMSSNYSKVDLLNKKVQDLTFQLNTTKDYLNVTQSKLRFEEEQFNKQIENLKKINQKLRKENQFMSGNDSEKTNIIQQKMIQLQKYKDLFKSTLLDWKNEKFQRHNLKLKYDQILIVMEHKNNQNKQKAHQISKLKGQIEQKQKELKISQLRYNEQKVFLEQTQRKANQIIQQFKNEVKRKVSYVHPLVQQDLKERLNRLTQKYLVIQKNYINIKDKLQEQNKKWQLQWQAMVSSFQTKLDNITNQKQNITFKKDTEIKYQKSRADSYKVELERYKQLQAAYRAKIQQRKTSQRQQQLMKIIQEKKKNIAILLKDLQISHDQNSMIKLEIEIKNRELCQKDQQIQEKIQQIKQEEQKRNNEKTKYQENIRVLSANYEIIKKQYVELQGKIDKIAQQRMSQKLSIKLQSLESKLIQNNRAKEGHQNGFMKTSYGRLSNESKRRLSMGRTIQNTYQYYSSHQEKR